jgi:predicted HD phosphohydrolase
LFLQVLVAEKFDQPANALVLDGVNDELVAAALLHDPSKPQDPELLGNV